MAQLNHPIFGTLDLAQAGYWQSKLTYAGRELSLELTLGADGASASSFDGLPQSASDLERMDQTARARILADAASGEEDCASIIYLAHHAEVLSPQQYARLFGVPVPDLRQPGPLLARLRLICVGLYLAQDDRRIVLDYSIDPDSTHYVLNVTLNSNGDAVALELES